MKIEEAIRLLDYGDPTAWGWCEAIKLVISVLEKQIPKECIDMTEEYIHKCPTCNGSITFHKQEYCDECGQALKWED